MQLFSLSMPSITSDSQKVKMNFVLYWPMNSWPIVQFLSLATKLIGLELHQKTNCVRTLSYISPPEKYVFFWHLQMSYWELTLFFFVTGQNPTIWAFFSTTGIVYVLGSKASGLRRRFPLVSSIYWLKKVRVEEENKHLYALLFHLLLFTENFETIPFRSPSCAPPFQFVNWNEKKLTQK